jgi:uncharacterized RDD family membrane protein YckC
MYYHDRAGFLIRLGAGLLDGLVLLGFGFIVMFVFQFNSPDNWISNLVDLLYYLLLPVFWYGYTLGKKWCGIRIVKEDGSQVGIGTMLLRNIVAALVYIITLGIGVFVSAFMIGLREDKRAIHDFIAGTHVTYNLPEEKMDLP